MHHVDTINPPILHIKSKKLLLSSWLFKIKVDLAEDNIYNFINRDQVDFIRFVLNNYIQEGIDELDISNLSTISNAKYESINEAQKELGSSSEIKEAFTYFCETV